MGVALLMHVAQAVNQLLEEVAGLTLRNTTTKRDKVEEFASANELENDKLDLFASLFGIQKLTLVYFDKANDISMLEVGQCGHLSVDKSLEGFI